MDHMIGEEPEADGCPVDALSDGSSDVALMDGVRAGDRSAAATLFVRHHAAALRAARAIAGQGVADDLVSEAFTRVLESLLQGHGPERALRPYLISTIRNLYVDGVRRSAREFPIGDEAMLDGAQPDGAAALAEQDAMARVLGTLPPRWREILWRTVVMGEPLSVVSVRMGLNPNSAAALNFRARAGLRRAFEEQVLAGLDGDGESFSPSRTVHGA